METFAAQVHGPFGWILAAEILIVCTLALATVFLLIKRIYRRDAGEAVVTRTANGEFQLSSEEGSICPVPGVSEEEVNSWKAKAAALEAETVKMAGMKSEYEALQQKVKFLESKLLEYEILQEEIGTLSTLKVENEKLKKEIVALEGSIEKSRVATDAAVASSNAVLASASESFAMAASGVGLDRPIGLEQPVVPPTPSTVDLPTDLPVIPPLPDLPLDMPMDTPVEMAAAPVSDPVEPALAPMDIVDKALAELDKDPVPAPQNKEAAAGLDSLLSEIDELSSNPEQK